MTGRISPSPSPTTPEAYLSGAIEHAADLGKGWRSRMREFLQDTLRHAVYDPAADEAKDLSPEEQANFRRWKREDPRRFRETVRKIIAWDLDRIERRSAYLIALWDGQSAKGGGTAAEITLAHRLGKPVYLVLGMPVEEASGWVLAAADEVFSTFEELQAALSSRYGVDG
ncbi:MAG: nucleoside 2-deoxyribosyltransferase [Acidobacteriota bacterium]|nr:nucleoside 2-deoxyribosyltransferase [Acidobacteriota bacterium]